ncbi:hypothetical protein, partial [Duganella vulcania]|uniref:hypothetical protein n=1 Tax=Duganella vulcania TaxID=2692166 RepID=UPI0020C51A49
AKLVELRLALLVGKQALFDHWNQVSIRLPTSCQSWGGFSRCPVHVMIEQHVQVGKVDPMLLEIAFPLVFVPSNHGTILSFHIRQRHELNQARLKSKNLSNHY